MENTKTKRKLTAILSADVKGYSRLMGEDEKATVATLKKYRDIISSLVEKHSGRVVDSPGDNLLAEFSSVVDAAESAVAIQKELKAKNAELPENRRMEFRIGINIGDVIAEGERIYGDGVNIAARVESLSESGGICVSGTAYDQIAKKLPLGYEFLGEQTVKNIEKPIRVYRVLMDPEAAGKVIGEKRPISRQWRWAALALIIVAGALAIWNFYIRPPFEPASVEKMAYPLPEKPSIAVLPFVNMSEDPKQEYFSDGLTEEIISALSKTPKMLVIARNSTFTYKGKAVKVNKVAEELGVQYVLEGSVRKTGDKLRITAQLIDAMTGHHVWAERYDRDLKDIFEMQDEVTMKILTSLQVTLTEGESARSFEKGTNSLEAYLKTIEGRELMSHLNKDDNALARRKFEEAIALDPKFARAYAGLSFTYTLDFMFRVDPKKALKKAYEYAQKAIALDDAQLLAHGALEFVYGWKRQHEMAIAAGERAVQVAPGCADAYFYLGRALNFACRDEQAVKQLEKAIRMNPFPPSFYYMHLGIAHFNLKQYEQAVSALKKASALNPKNISARRMLTVTYVEMGQLEQARVEADEILKINPKFTSKGMGKIVPFKDPEVVRRWVEALRTVGLERDI
jgi:TolB-like protein/class 3 adenylate cyclase/Flp pilus assembly protein TadD